MSEKSLPLLVQSSRDALGECLGDLEKALEAVEGMEHEGDTPPIRASQLERARAQCLAAHRMLDDLARRLA